jgi:hypothetical protein
MQMNEGLLATARRERRRLGLTRIPAAQIDHLESREMLSTTYTITVHDIYGYPLSGASVSVDTPTACYAPVISNSLGQVKITASSPIRTVVTTKAGYVPSYSSSTTGVANLSPILRPNATILLVNRMLVIAADVLVLQSGSVLLGQTTLNQILSRTSIVTGATGLYCAIASSPVATLPATGPCSIVSGVAFASATFAQALYSEGIADGILPNVNLNVYYSLTSHTILLLPAH